MKTLELHNPMIQFLIMRHRCYSKSSHSQGFCWNFLEYGQTIPQQSRIRTSKFPNLSRLRPLSIHKSSFRLFRSMIQSNASANFKLIEMLKQGDFFWKLNQVISLKLIASGYSFWRKLNYLDKSFNWVRKRSK